MKRFDECIADILRINPWFARGFWQYIAKRPEQLQIAFPQLTVEERADLITRAQARFGTGQIQEQENILTILKQLNKKTILFAELLKQYNEKYQTNLQPRTLAMHLKQMQIKTYHGLHNEVYVDLEGKIGKRKG